MFPVNFFIDAERDVPAEGYIPRATYSPCRDGCAGCGRPLAVQDADGYPKRYLIGVGVYHLRCYRKEKRAIAETERVLTKAGLGRAGRPPKVS